MSAAIPYDADYYKRHPLTCAPDDYWGQVRRTVRGQPVSEEQIQMIVSAVQSGLKLGPDDRLLDLCCGNGALTDRFFALCGGGLGVDFSPPLIETAQRAFARPPLCTYVLSDVVAWLGADDGSGGFTAALCYGSFSYLSDGEAQQALHALASRQSTISRVFIGNLPDLDAADRLFAGRTREPGIERRHDSQFGILRTEAQFVALAQRTGWACTIRRMPDAFYAGSSRYDALLTREDRHV